MAFEIRILEDAKFDLQDYARYILKKEKSEEAVERWIEGFTARLQVLEDHAESFDEIPEDIPSPYKYQSINYKSHRIIYRVDKRAGRVLVMRVYHGARQPLKPSDLQGFNL